MQIQINLDTASISDVRILASLSDELVRELTDKVEQECESAVAAVREQTQGPAQAQDVVAQPVAEQPRRTRRTKAEMEAAKSATQPEIEQAATQPAEHPATPPATQLPSATEQPAAVSIDELRSALQDYTSAKGMPAGIELLKKFGCSRISELDAQDAGTKRGFLKDAKV